MRFPGYQAIQETTVLKIIGEIHILGNVTVDLQVPSSMAHQLLIFVVLIFTTQL